MIQLNRILQTLLTAIIWARRSPGDPGIINTGTKVVGISGSQDCNLYNYNNDKWYKQNNYLICKYKKKKTKK